jgi:hypothetical protein
MANIGQFKVGKEWEKIDDLTGFSFVSENSYTIQNRGYQALQLCIAESKPDTDNVGFIINQSEAVGYTAESGKFLWLKAVDNTTEFNVAEGV